jgi:hypothetical protein
MMSGMISATEPQEWWMTNMPWRCTASYIWAQRGLRCFLQRFGPMMTPRWSPQSSPNQIASTGSSALYSTNVRYSFVRRSSASSKKSGAATTSVNRFSKPRRFQLRSNSPQPNIAT